MNKTATMDVREIERRLGYTDVKELMPAIQRAQEQQRARSKSRERRKAAGVGPTSTTASKDASHQHQQASQRTFGHNSYNSSSYQSYQQQVQQQQQQPQHYLYHNHQQHEQQPEQYQQQEAAMGQYYSEQPSSNTTGQRPYKKMISATKRTRELMRQVSGLGMEDPVFGTKEKTPVHPSLIFDDMSVNDLPEEMRDMVSVASDPTATFDDDGRGGVDMEMFQQSLGHMHCSISDFSMGNIPTTITAAASSGGGGVASAPQSPGGKMSMMSGNTVSDSSPGNNSAQHQNQQTKTQLKRRISLRLRRRSTTDERSTDGANGNLGPANLHASIGTLQSLDLEDVLNLSKADRDRSSRNPNEQNNNSRGSRGSNASRKSRASRTGTTTCSSSNDDSNNLIREAALAMQQREGCNASNHDLIVAALSQSLSHLDCNAEELLMHNSESQARRLERKASSNAAAGMSHYEAPEQGSPEGKKSKFVSKQRVMPSINALFPDDAPAPAVHVAPKSPAPARRRSRSVKRGTSKTSLSALPLTEKSTSPKSPRPSTGGKFVLPSSTTSGAAKPGGASRGMNEMFDNSMLSGSDHNTITSSASKREKIKAPANALYNDQLLRQIRDQGSVEGVASGVVKRVAVRAKRRPSLGRRGSFSSGSQSFGFGFGRNSSQRSIEGNSHRQLSPARPTGSGRRRSGNAADATPSNISGFIRA